MVEKNVDETGLIDYTNLADGFDRPGNIIAITTDDISSYGPCDILDIKQEDSKPFIHFGISGFNQMRDDGFLAIFIKSYHEFISLPNYSNKLFTSYGFPVFYYVENHKPLFAHVLQQEWGPGELFCVLSSITTLYANGIDVGTLIEELDSFFPLIKNNYFPLSNQKVMTIDSASFAFAPFFILRDNATQETVNFLNKFVLSKRTIKNYQDYWATYLLMTDDTYRTFGEAMKVVKDGSCYVDLTKYSSSILDFFCGELFQHFMINDAKDTLTKKSILLLYNNKNYERLTNELRKPFYNPLMKQYAQEHPDSFGVYDYAFSDDDMKKIENDERFSDGYGKIPNAMQKILYLLMMKYGYDRGLWLFDAISEEGFDSIEQYHHYTSDFIEKHENVKIALCTWMIQDQGFCDALDAFMKDSSIPLSLYYAMFVKV